MSMTLDECKPETRVWVLATGFWRRGLVVSALRVNVIVRYALKDGRTRDTRVKPSDLEPASFDPLGNLETVPPWAVRLIAKASLWD